MPTLKAKAKDLPENKESPPVATVITELDHEEEKLQRQCSHRKQQHFSMECNKSKQRLERPLRRR
eukprot:4678078-Amphidinium_carterae.1